MASNEAQEAPMVSSTPVAAPATTNTMPEFENGMRHRRRSEIIPGDGHDLELRAMQYAFGAAGDELHNATAAPTSAPTPAEPAQDLLQAWPEDEEEGDVSG